MIIKTIICGFIIINRLVFDRNKVGNYLVAIRNVSQVRSCHIFSKVAIATKNF